MDALFQDRTEAGKALAECVARFLRDASPLVLALPRGGVPVGFEVSSILSAQLDTFLVRKLGLPGREELAIGAIASGGITVLNESIIDDLQLSRTLIDKITAREEQLLKQQDDFYREGRPALRVRDRTIVLVDDGLATGATMKAACRAIRVQEPKRIIATVPVAAREVCEELREYSDEVVCLYTPRPFFAVGAWYRNFSQTTDDEVRRLLRLADQSYRIRFSAESRE